MTQLRLVFSFLREKNVSFFLFFKKWIQIDWFKMVFTNVLMSFSVKTKQFSGVESD